MERQYHVENKKVVLTIMFIIATAIIVLAVIIGRWQIGLLPSALTGLLLSVMIDYWYFCEFYPSTSVKRAERIMRSGRVHQIKGKTIPCPAYFIKLMAGKNRSLHRHNQTFRWFLTNSLESFDGKNIKVIKIEGKDCWFFTQDCYSQSYVEEKKKIRIRKKEQESKQKTAAS